MPFLKYKHLKLKLRVFLAGHSVAMVTYCVTKIIPTRWPVIGQFFWYHDCSINCLRLKILTHQNLSLVMCWKLFWVTLRHRGAIQAVSVYVRNIKKYMGILKSLNMVNLYRGMSKLKLKINVEVPRLPCIVVSMALNSQRKTHQIAQLRH